MRNIGLLTLAFLLIVVAKPAMAERTRSAGQDAITRTYLKHSAGVIVSATVYAREPEDPNLPTSHELEQLALRIIAEKGIPAHTTEGYVKDAKTLLDLFDNRFVYLNIQLTVNKANDDAYIYDLVTSYVGGAVLKRDSSSEVEATLWEKHILDMGLTDGIRSKMLSATSASAARARDVYLNSKSSNP